MNTAIYMLRVVQLGLGLKDLDQLSLGMVMDMIIESGNDDCKYREVANQSDFDKF